MDEQILALSNSFETIFRRAKNKESKERLRTIKDLDRAALTLSDIVELFMDGSIDASLIRQQVLNKYPEEHISDAVSQVRQLVKNEQEPIAIAELLRSYRKFRKFIPDILETLSFEGTLYGQKCMEIWAFIQRRFPKPITYKMLPSIEDSLSKKWLYYIRENPDQTNNCILIAAIELLIQSLKRHDVFITQSTLYNNPMDCLIDEVNWAQQKNVLIEQLALPASAIELASRLTEDLSLSYENS